MKRQSHPPNHPGPMDLIHHAFQAIIRWVRLLGSPRGLNHQAPEASWITHSRKEALRHGVTPPIIVRYTFRIRLCPTSPDSFHSNSRN